MVSTKSVVVLVFGVAAAATSPPAAAAACTAWSSLLFEVTQISAYGQFSLSMPACLHMSAARRREYAGARRKAREMLMGGVDGCGMLRRELRRKGRVQCSQLFRSIRCGSMRSRHVLVSINVIFG